MPNLRVIYQNLADSATLTASSTTGSYSAQNMQTELKSQFHRSSGTSVTYNLTWTTDQTINSVVLPCTNLTNTATIEITLQSSTDNSNYSNIVVQPGVLAAASTKIADFIVYSKTNPGQIETAPNGNLFAYGAVTKTSHWFEQTYNNVRKVIITLTDTNNPATFIDCSRIICGNYWQPAYNASKEGLILTIFDTSTNTRNDAGDLISEQGFVYDQLQLNLDVLTDADRDTLLALARSRGVSQNILISVFPENRSSTELAYLVYGKKSNSSINYITPGFTNTNLEFTGW